MSMHFLRRPAYAGMALFITSVFQSASVQACSSCGCTLNSDWSSQGYSVASGARLDVREDYYDQNQLRSDTHAVDRSSLEIPNEQEIQQRTLNHNTTLGVDYSPSRTWGMHLDVPYFNRFHTTIGEGDEDISTSHTQGLGDVRITARYQGFSPDLSWGIQLGVKLPTGRSDDQFTSGPLTGEVIDRGLQQGTGTTDVIVGLYNFGNLAAHLGYFVHVNVQHAMNSHHDFKPGDAFNISTGLRYLHAGRWSPQVQLNLHVEGRESGAESDRDNSGASLLYVSPGTTVQVVQTLQLYAFLQLPLYQRVNGLQLQPQRFYSLGAQYKF